MIIVKLILTVAVIIGAAEAAKRSVWLGALIVTLPLLSMLSMIWIYLDSRDSARVSAYAREIFYLVPISLVFFLPFLLEPRSHWPFWVNFGVGVGLLATLVAVMGLWRGS